MSAYTVDGLIELVVWAEHDNLPAQARLALCGGAEVALLAHEVRRLRRIERAAEAWAKAEPEITCPGGGPLCGPCGAAAALRAALQGRGMNATPPLGDHNPYCYDDPSHLGPCRPVK